VILKSLTHSFFKKDSSWPLNTRNTAITHLKKGLSFARAFCIKIAYSL